MILHPTILKIAKFLLILICMLSALLVSLLGSTSGPLASLIILTNENGLTQGGTGCFYLRNIYLTLLFLFRVFS